MGKRYQLAIYLVQKNRKELICKGGIGASLTTATAWAEWNNQNDAESLQNGGFYLHEVIEADKLYMTYPADYATAERRRLKATTTAKGSRAYRLGKIKAEELAQEPLSLVARLEDGSIQWKGRAWAIRTFADGDIMADFYLGNCEA